MRTGITWIFGALAAVALAGGGAWAAHHEGGEGHDKGKGYHGKRFENRDTDGNGEISKAEWLAASEEHFAKLDADGNGSVTRDEMKAAHKKMKDRRAKAKGDEANEE